MKDNADHIPPREVLNAAKMATFLWVPTSDEAKRFVAQLVKLTLEHEDQVEPRKRQRKAADLRSFKDAIAAFAADLLHHSLNAESQGFCYRPSERSALGDTKVSSISFDKLVPWWKAMGLLELIGSINIRETFEGLCCANPVTAAPSLSLDRPIPCAA